MQERVQGPEWAGAVAHPSPEQLHRADQTRPGQPQGEPTSPETQGREGEHAHVCGLEPCASAVFKQACVCVPCKHAQLLCSHTWLCVCVCVCVFVCVSACASAGVTLHTLRLWHGGSPVWPACPSPQGCPPSRAFAPDRFSERAGRGSGLGGGSPCLLSLPPTECYPSCSPCRAGQLPATPARPC